MYPALNADGRFVVFASEATNLSPEDPTTERDACIRELRVAAATTPL
jgi:hypothetical protein